MSQRLEHRQAPKRLSTDRLTLRRPRSADAAAILQSYAADPEVTRLLAWPRHRWVEDTLSFLTWSDQVWGNTRAGPYLILDREDRVLGTTASTSRRRGAPPPGTCSGATPGRGLASEAAVALTRLADDLGVIRLHALCHRDNTASARVLAKAGFLREGVLRRYPAGSAGRGCSRGICSGRTVRRGGQGFLASAAAPSGVGVVGQPASLLANIDVVWSVSTAPFVLSARARRKNPASSESPSLPNHHA